MRNKTSTWIFFFLFVLTASGVFAAMVENSHQGLPAISVTSHPAFSLENSEQRQGLSRVLLELMSGGAFISKDPIGFRGGHNLWRYADNNPVLLVDPFGLLTKAERDALKRDIDKFLLIRTRFENMFAYWKVGEPWENYGIEDKNPLSTQSGHSGEGFNELSALTREIITDKVYWSIPTFTNSLVMGLYFQFALKIPPFNIINSEYFTGMPLAEQRELARMIMENYRNEVVILELKKVYEEEKDKCPEP